MSDQFAPISRGERIELIDVLRGLAVGGILIGNMQWFSAYGFAPASVTATWPIADQVTQFLVHFFVEGKFYSVFSFLFGFGFALQITRAAERGDTRATVFKRRLAWLFVIGVLHATLLWYGDILSVYAVMGFILVLFRNRKDRTLLKWALGFIILPVLTYALLFILFKSFAPADVAATVSGAQADMYRQTIETIPNSTWREVVSGYNLQGLAGRWIGLVVQMRLPKILAMFLMGFYAYRRGFFEDLSTHRTTVRNVLIYGLSIGLILNVVFAALAGNEAPFPPSAGALVGVIAYAFGVPALALGYIAAVTLLWQTRVRGLISLVAPVGRMALTNYLMHTVVCVVIFYGYGFGFFGKIGPLAVTLIAIGIFLLQIPLSTLWLRYFAYGPMEWIWRQLTYRKRLPLRVAQSRTAPA
jgi:uncharacterized protein